MAVNGNISGSSVMQCNVVLCMLFYFIGRFLCESQLAGFPGSFILLFPEGNLVKCVARMSCRPDVLSVTQPNH